MTVFFGAALAPASAIAGGDAVLVDCVDGALKPSYSVADYREALEETPTDLAEYTDCASQIRAGLDRALAEARAGGSPYVGRSKATALPRTGGAAASGVTEDGASNARAGAATTGTEPTTPPANQTGPTNDEASDPEFLAMPVAGGDGPSAETDDAGIPVIPAVIALSVIALTAARGLLAWSRRPERLDTDPAAPVAPVAPAPAAGPA